MVPLSKPEDISENNVDSIATGDYIELKKEPGTKYYVAHAPSSPFFVFPGEPKEIRKGLLLFLTAYRYDAKCAIQRLPRMNVACIFYIDFPRRRVNPRDISRRFRVMDPLDYSHLLDKVIAGIRVGNHYLFWPILKCSFLDASKLDPNSDHLSYTNMHGTNHETVRHMSALKVLLPSLHWNRRI